MDLPSPIEAYLDADRSRDDKAIIRAFTRDAVVKDEGRSHAGHQAIGAWWRETKEKYQTVMEPLRMSEEGGVTKVTIKVTGRFSGSPASINFAFRLDGERIVNLKITA